MNNSNKDAQAYPAHVTAPENYAWREREWRRPPVNDGETILIEEPGRVLPPRGETGQGTCCRSHYFLVVKQQYGGALLRVRHGAGVEEWRLGWDYERVVKGLQALDSDTRFRFLWTLMDARHEAEREAAERTASKYREAFVEGRLKKRKKRGTNEVRVWIEPKKPH